MGTRLNLSKMLQQLAGAIAKLERIHDETARVLDMDREVEALTTHVQAFYENASRYEDLQKSRDRLEQLMEIDRVISSTLDLREVAHHMLQAAMESAGAERGTLQLLEDDKLVDYAGIGYAEGREDVQLDVGQGITGWVVQHGKPALVADVKDEDWGALFVGVMAEETRSELAVPLPLGGDTIGVINVESPNVGAFDEDDQVFLQALAGQAVIAVRNASRYEDLQKSRDRLEQLMEIDRVISSTLDLREVAHHMLQAAMESAGAERGTLQLLEDDKLVDYAGIGYAEGREDVQLDVGQGITGWVVQHGKPALVADVKDEDWGALFVGVMAEETRSELAVPLPLGGDTIGVINVESPNVGAFDEDDQVFLQALAGQAVIAVVNARAHENLQDTCLQLERERKKRVDAETAVALGDLSHVLAHNIVNQIGFIRARASEIEQEYAGDSRLQTKSRRVVRAAEEALSLIGDLKSTVGKATEEVHFKDSNVNLLLDKARMSVNIPATIEVVQDLADDLPTVRAEEARLMEVFRNLVQNAVDAMPDGGSLGLATEDTESGWVEIRVKDTGHGITKEDRSRVFKLFFHKKKNDTPGWGFGLWWSKVFLEKLGGEIAFETVAGVGTTFVIRLPIDD